MTSLAAMSSVFGFPSTKGDEADGAAGDTFGCERGLWNQLAHFGLREQKNLLHFLAGFGVVGDAGEPTQPRARRYRKKLKPGKEEVRLYREMLVECLDESD